MLMLFVCRGEARPQPSTITGPTGERRAAAEAMHDLLKAIAAFKYYLGARDLLVIHNYDNTIRSTMTLHQYAGLAMDGRAGELRSTLLQLKVTVMTFHAAADASDQARAEREFRNVEEGMKILKTLYPPDFLDEAARVPDKYICPMHADVVGVEGESCPKCGMNLEPAGAFSETYIPMPPIQARVRTDIPLEIGARVQALLTLLQSDGTPVRLGDLREMHTKKIHLFIIDSSLTDYHHEHPVATDSAGRYTFTFTPRKPGPYRVWADLVPVLTGRQEYAMTDIPAATPGEPLQDTSVTHAAAVEELTYELYFDDPVLRIGKATRARLRITDSDGSPFTQLEPIMAAFAHLVGFSEDHSTIMHIHPTGIGPQSPGERGGPELEFFLYPTRAGFMRLFAQVQIGGVSKFAPFGIRISP
jgi:hypothetical protein